MTQDSPGSYDNFQFRPELKHWVFLYLLINEVIVTREFYLSRCLEFVIRTTAIKCPRVGGRRECCIFALSRVGWAR